MIVTLAVVAALLFSNLSGAEASVKIRKAGNLPPALAHATFLGEAPADAPLRVTLGFGLRDPAGLEAFLERLNDPTSPDYRSFISPDEFQARFGPEPATIARGKAWLESQGFVVSEITSRHIAGDGTIALAERAFDVEIGYYDDDGRRAIANDREPALPADLVDDVVNVGGLENLTLVLPAHSVPELVGPALPVLPLPEQAPAPNYQVSGTSFFTDRDLQVSYGQKAGYFDQGKRGTPGATIAIASQYDISLADVNDVLQRQGYSQFTSGATGTRTTSSTCAVNTGSGNGCSYDATDFNSFETLLDFDMVSGISNDAHVGVYLTTSNSQSGFSMLYQYLADRASTIKVVSHSWGLCVALMAPSVIDDDEIAFAQAEAGGQAWFVATGDHGSNDCNGYPGAPNPSTDYPASSRHVTGAGGTWLQNNFGADGWTTGHATETGCADGGGGKTNTAPAGTGGYFTKPSWQSGSGVPTDNLRMVPDISGHYGVCSNSGSSTSGILVRMGNFLYASGGTSAVAPMWASFWNVGNQVVGENLGHAAPLLYRILRGEASTSYASSFWDVTTGSNGAHSAAANYDLVTGLGAPKFTGLYGDLQKLVNAKVNAAIGAPANGATFTRLDSIQFNDASTQVNCPITGRTWQFGDGTTSTTQHPTKTYSALGTFTVNLTVTGSCGSSSTKSISVVIQNVRPTAGISASPNPQTAGVGVTISGASSTDSDGSIATYRFTVDGVQQPDQSSATLAKTFTTAGSHTASLTVVDNNGGTSATPASTTITITAGALASITVSPASANVAAGGSRSFTATGADAWGNAVSISPTWSATCGSVTSSGAYTAPTATGSCTVRATQGSVQGSATATIVAAALHRIAVSPSTVTVQPGGSQTFTAQGYDVYNNPVSTTVTWTASCGSITQAGAYTAPTSGGPCTVTASSGSISGTATVTLAARVLARIVVSPASVTLAVTGTQSYTAQGYDQLNEPIAISPTWSATCGSVSGSGSYTAPTSVGTCRIQAAQGSVAGTANATIVAGPLDHVTVTPDGASVVAGKTRAYSAAGFDLYGNAVPITPTWSATRGSMSGATYTAPTSSGADTVRATANGISGTAGVSVIADALHHMTVTGPSQVTVATTAQYTANGFDQYNNPTTPAPTWSTNIGSISSSGLFTAQTLVTSGSVAATQSGISASLPVALRAGPATSVRVTPSGITMNVAQSILFTAQGQDQYGNSAPASAFTWSTNQGTVLSSGLFTPSQTGVAVVTAASGAIQGSASVNVINRLTLTMETEKSQYLPHESLLGVNGWVRVKFNNGASVPLANLQIRYSRVLATGGETLVTQGTGQTTSDGLYDFIAPTTHSLPGTYRINVTANWGGNVGYAVVLYRVTPST